MAAAAAFVTLLGASLTAPAQTLTHRYSFNDPAASTTFSDSVGGAAWDGSLVGNAVLDGANLVLDGQGSFALLPANIISGQTQMTVEFWADLGPSAAPWSRVFSFGDQSTDGNKSSGVDYAHFAGGNYQNLDLVATNADAYANNPSGLDGTTNVHVTVVVDTLNGALYYYNGVNIVSTQHNPVPSLLAVSDPINVIGRSLVDVDPTLTGTIHEFRVYNGVLPRSAVELNDASGPDNYLTNPGSLVALRFSSSANPIVINQSAPQIITGDFTSVSNVDLSIYGGVTYSTGNPNVITVSTNGVVKGTGVGTTTVVAVAGSLRATNTITVINPPAALAHRYSFTSGPVVTDSVGGADGALMGNAVISGGQVVLDGSDGTYVNLPGGQINIATNAAVTFEAWTSIGNTPQWSRLFEFGNTTGGNGNNSIYCAPVADGGFHEFGLSENFPVGGQTLNWAHGWTNLTLHITGVVDPTTSSLAVYTNGVLMQARYDASQPVSTIATNLAYLGKSTFNDPYAVLSIDEFRIYSGALSAAQVAASDLHGPNTVNFDPGTLQSITVAATNYPAYSALVAPVIHATYSALANFNLMPNLMASIPGLVVTSSDTNVVTVNGQNLLTTHAPGIVTLTATYQGKTNSATVRINNEAALTHRYSFTPDTAVNGTVSDSVGGADGQLMGTATVSGGQVQLDGGSSDYVNLPPGLLSTYDSTTIDTWATISSSQGPWSRVWEFADVGPSKSDEFYFAPAWNGDRSANFTSFGVPFGGGFININGGLINQTIHFTCVLGNGSMDVYTNGVFFGSAGNIVAPASQAGIFDSWIGFSPYGDPGITGSVDEFRIYRGRLSPQEILASDLLGPNATLSTTASLSVARSGNSLVLTWPLADASFSLQTRSSLSPGSPWMTLTNVPVYNGTNWQVSVPVTGTSQFFELAH
jgi:hypothetical protein